MASPDPTDEELASHARDGSPDAFNELVQRGYGRRVIAFLTKTCGVPAGDAEDVAQEVWLKAFRALSTWRPHNFRSWLFKIARNAARDHLKQFNRRRAESLDTSGAEPQTASQDVGREAEIRDQLTRLDGCLKKLNPDFRSAFEGHTGGRKYEELAEGAGVPIDTIKTRIYRARTALRKCMGMDEE